MCEVSFVRLDLSKPRTKSHFTGWATIYLLILSNHINPVKLTLHAKLTKSALTCVRRKQLAFKHCNLSVNHAIEVQLTATAKSNVLRNICERRSLRADGPSVVDNSPRSTASIRSSDSAAHFASISLIRSSSRLPKEYQLTSALSRTESDELCLNRFKGHVCMIDGLFPSVKKVRTALEIANCDLKTGF